MCNNIPGDLLINDYNYLQVCGRLLVRMCVCVCVC